MMEIFKTLNEQLNQLDHFEDGVWVNLVNPDEGEIRKVCEGLKLDPDYVRAALDEEERARIEYENGHTLILVDIPVVEADGKAYVYTTIPLGIIITGDSITTVCLKDNPVIRSFRNNKVKSFYTFKKTRFILQILYRNSTSYLQYLKQIDKASGRIENELHESMKNKELIQLLKLEKSLVYFSTSLKSNELVLEKMLKLEYIKKYPEDTDLLEDVIVENKQAIEMASIYSSTLNGTMDAFASIISNNLNIVMKFLASITIVMAIPTMVASFFGMNVPVPLGGNNYAFMIVLLISFVLSVISAYILARKKMF